jgi:hypothetical protein
VQKCAEYNEFIGVITYDCQPHWDIHWCNATGAGVYTHTLPAPTNGYLIEATELPDEAALVMPDPTGYSCTLASVVGPVVWNLTSFESRLHQQNQLSPVNLQTIVQFQFQTSVYQVEQSGYPEWIDAEWMYDIPGNMIRNYQYRQDGKYAKSDQIPFPAVSFNDLGWKMYFNPITRGFELQTSWYCDDKDAQHP